MAGLTLGGGSGWLERKHGLAADNLVAVELVTASGEPVRASADEHPELFWALRGGGGNFGVVTALELRLHEVGPEILGGLVLYPRSQARETLRHFRDYMLDAPEEVSLAYVFLTAPDEDGIPEELRGQPAVAIAGMHAGGARRRRGRARPDPRVRAPALDAFGPTGYADFQCSLDDPPGYRNWWTAEYLDDLPDDAIDAMVAHAEELPAGPAQIFIPAWGGAVARGTEGPLTGPRRALRRASAAAVGGRRRRRAQHRPRPPLARHGRPVPDRRHLPQLRRRGGRGPRPRRLRPALRAARAREGRVGPGQRVPGHRQRAPQPTRETPDVLPAPRREYPVRSPLPRSPRSLKQ